jgi:leader peptidase (prepilin peptidase)/N-methyltransferase
MAACAGGRQLSQAKDRPMSSFASAVGVGLLGVVAGVPAWAVIQRLAGPPAAAQAGRRWPGIAPAMGLLWFAVTLRLAGQGLGWAVPACLALAFVCLVLAVIDAATGLLPNRITYPAFPVVAGLLLAASLGLGELGRLGRGLLAAASVGGVFLLLALLSPHAMGVGDVKLAPTLGLALGWLSWGTVAVGVFAAFLLGGLAGLGGMLALGLSRTSRLPFGPWLVVGALLGVLVGGEVAGWFQAAKLGAR